MLLLQNDVHNQTLGMSARYRGSTPRLVLLDESKPYHSWMMSPISHDGRPVWPGRCKECDEAGSTECSDKESFSRIKAMLPRNGLDYHQYLVEDSHHSAESVTTLTMTRGLKLDRLLELAVDRNDAEMADFLINRGADVFGSCESKKPYAFSAATNNRASILSIFLEVGGLDPNFVWDTLHILADAVLSRSYDVIDILLDAGADVSYINSDGIGILECCIWSPGFRDFPREIILRILELLPMDAIDLPKKNPPLLHAMKRSASYTDLLLDRGADINCACAALAEQRKLGEPVFLDIPLACSDALKRAASEHWLLPRQRVFGRPAREVILATLLCAKRQGLWLPTELWLLVFEFISRRDFILEY